MDGFLIKRNSPKSHGSDYSSNVELIDWSLVVFVDRPGVYRLLSCVSAMKSVCIGHGSRIKNRMYRCLRS